jgi:glucose-1-phosphate thymidylyltransferase
MLAGIDEFVIISNPKEKQVFQELFKDAKKYLGVNIEFAVQETPKGIADAFNGVYDHLFDRVSAYDRIALILGDNIFYGASLTSMLKWANVVHSAVTFALQVNDPERFGVVEIDKYGNALSIEEKPKDPKSNLAVTGLYFYPKDVFAKVRGLSPSAREELEITDLNKLYLEEKRLTVQKMLRGMVWFDTGTADSLMEAAQFIQTLQNIQGIMIGSPHEVAYNNSWIDEENLRYTAELCGKTEYGKYLKALKP